VTGVARSGTTALAELLNSHARICIGIERFKFRYLRENDYSADLFRRERFFDFRPADTNLLPAVRPHWKPVYELMEQKWDQAEVIGDKVPDLIPTLADFMAANPGFRFICTLRNLKDVGLSWQARADKPRDSWPADKGFVQACESWAEQMRILFTLLREQPDIRSRLLLLDYDQMYAPGNTTMAVIRGFLGIGPSKSFRRAFTRHEAFFSNRQPSEVPAEHVNSYKAVDMTFARGLRREARLMAERWSADPALAGDLAAIRPQPAVRDPQARNPQE